MTGIIITMSKHELGNSNGSGYFHSEQVYIPISSPKLESLIRQGYELSAAMIGPEPISLYFGGGGNSK